MEDVSYSAIQLQRASSDCVLSPLNEVSEISKAGSLLVDVRHNNVEVSGASKCSPSFHLRMIERRHVCTSLSPRAFSAIDSFAGPSVLGFEFSACQACKVLLQDSVD